ncbi:MAG TPA: Flp family type IVb pilin [Dehalococcoidia bacterium]|nr:Flp family type IVb pilin [Dehalococcoidia bacterium]
MTNMIQALSNFVGRGEKGQGLVEYALIIVLVSVALVLALGTLATEIESVFTEIGNSFPG